MQSPDPRPPQDDHWRRLERLERLARTLDGRFRVPGTRLRVGWDSIIGLVPGVGDLAMAAPAAWIVLEGHRMGLPNSVKARMVFNVGADLAIGSVPVVGDLLDVGFKANRRNVALIRAHMEGRGARPHAAGDTGEPPVMEAGAMRARAGTRAVIPKSAPTGPRAAPGAAPGAPDVAVTRPGPNR